MFLVGDRVVYPFHGAGMIDAIEEKEVLGKRQQYYILKMATEALGKMQIMIPIERSRESGIRQIVDLDTLEGVLHHLLGDKVETSVNWNQRFRINMDKMKSGDIFKVAEVIRDLAGLNKIKPLGTGEKNMLDNAMRILISEIVLVKEISEEDAAKYLNQIVYE